MTTPQPNPKAPDELKGLYERRAAALVLYGRALGLSHSEAEDVLHDTFVALMKMQASPVKLEHYCVRSFRNRALNYRRSVWRRVAREWESLRWFEAVPNEAGREAAAMKRLAELPGPQREVIVLKIWHEYTFEAISELLETSPNTIAGRYRYGMKKLRGQLINPSYEHEYIGTGNAFLETPATFPTSGAATV
jgi:RNA polymerase sigma factor (sigma-70 family)